MMPNEFLARGTNGTAPMSFELAEIQAYYRLEEEDMKNRRKRMKRGAKAE